MIFHTVLLTPKSETTPEEIERALLHVRELQSKIPGITSVTTGANLNTTQKNHGYTYGFLLVFDTEEHFLAYAPHPDHQPISQELRRTCQSILDFDLRQE